MKRNYNSSSTTKSNFTKFEDLNGDCVENILMMMTAPNVSNFAVACPKYLEAVQSYWIKKAVINIDDILDREVNVLRKCLKLCGNLKKIKLTRFRNIPFGEVITDAIIACPKLEILDIPGIELSATELTYLMFCDNLKTLKITTKFDTLATKAKLQRIYANNSNLETLRLRSGNRYAVSFPTLPMKTKNLKIEVLLTESDLASVLDSLSRHEVLEKLSLPRQPLSTEDIIRLQGLTKLKRLDIGFRADDSAISVLFRNNPALEDVSLRCTSLQGELLRLLPNGIKRFAISAAELLNIPTLVESVKLWNIESLSILFFSYDIENFLPKIVEAAPTLKKLTMHCLKMDVNDINSLKRLKQLKILRIVALPESSNTQLEAIFENADTLELLDLAYVKFTFSLKLFDSIAALPKLERFHIQMCSCNNMIDENYNLLMQRLSRSKSLTSVRIGTWVGFNPLAMIELVRGCKTLTFLEFSSDYLSKSLVEQLNVVLNDQKGRTDPLRVRVLFSGALQMIAKPKMHLHHLLELNYSVWD